MPAYGVHDGAKVVVCSKELAEMFGATSAAEVLGRDVLSFVSAEAHSDAIAAVQNGGRGLYRSMGTRVDGGAFPIEISSAPIRWLDVGEARLVMVRDLSPVAMVVDDESPVARLTSALLRHAGYQTAMYTSPQQALADYRAGAASVIVTDVRMPECDGVAMVQHIRKIDPAVPVVFMSGYSEIDVPQDESTALLKKPFGISDLERALHELPERARSLLK